MYPHLNTARAVPAAQSNPNISFSLSQFGFPLSISSRLSRSNGLAMNATGTPRKAVDSYSPLIAMIRPGCLDLGECQAMMQQFKSVHDGHAKIGQQDVELLGQQIPQPFFAVALSQRPHRHPGAVCSWRRRVGASSSTISTRDFFGRSLVATLVTGKNMIVSLEA